FPGGFGTLDEGLEVLTLLQTGKRDMVPVVFIDAPGGDFWKDFHEFIVKQLKKTGMISPEDTSLYMLTDSCEEAVNEVLNFYRVYHSMRYVRNKLVVRMKEPISDELLADINRHFSDILAEGEIVQQEALEEEKDDPLLLDLPRLVFRFN